LFISKGGKIDLTGCGFPGGEYNKQSNKSYFRKEENNHNKINSIVHLQVQSSLVRIKMVEMLEDLK
jgi:hypothetical protein